ncbi:MAG: DNA methyltransferase [Nitrospirota bacterium]
MEKPIREQLMKHNMKFIEKSFPVEYLNQVAMAEGNAKKPVYQMHKWWARRLGSVFRMITLSAFSDQTVSDNDIWQHFCNGARRDGVIVLDPFMGGGTTVVEALRLGCKVIGVDINPVAWFVTKKEIEPVELANLDTAFQELEKSAGNFIKQYYLTSCPSGHAAEVMYYFWVKIAICKTCSSLIKLFPNYELSRRNHANVVLCPKCSQIIETLGHDPKTQCSECGTVFDPREGVSSRGIFRCSECRTEQRILDAINENGGRLNVELYALEGFCNSCGRFFKRVDLNDIALWKRAKNEYEKHKNTLLIPHQKIPTEGRSDPRPVNHGYTHFKDMFNERQLLCLSHLLRQILKITDTNIRELMLIAFSDCLDANNMFCKYEIEWHKISLFFGLHAFHPIERPTENNIWGTEYGRGTFVKCFEKVRRAKLFCKKPHERLPTENNRRFSKHTDNERIEGNIVESFEKLEPVDRAALLRCNTAENLSFIPDKTVDAVITDPPYFDNIQYSELADFFYVWLRLGLRDLYPCFIPELSSRSNEIVQNEKMGKTIEFFNEGLTRVFAGCHRVLKDEGLLIFTFHHNKLWAWESIGKILLDAGFYISATPIVRSEGKSGFHSSKGNIRYDCILVCRKRPSKWDNDSWISLKELILKDAIMWTKRTLKSGMLITEVDIFTIIMGKTIEYYTKAFPNIKHYNEPITLAEALHEMKEFADHVTESAQPEKPLVSKCYSKKAEQLTLFIKESREKYG